MKKIASIVIMAILASGAIFSSCKKEKEEKLSATKVEKVDVFTPEDRMLVLNNEGDYCSSVKNYLELFFTDFIVSYLDADGTIKTYIVYPRMELYDMFCKIFLHKVDTFRGTHAELCAWSKEQMGKGNIVISHYDKESGEYVGAGYTPAEYKEKYGK